MEIRKFVIQRGIDGGSLLSGVRLMRNCAVNPVLIGASLATMREWWWWVFLFLTRQTVSSIFLSVRLSVCSYLCLSVNFFLLFTWMHMMGINWIHAISTLFKLIFFFLLKILDYFLVLTSIWEGQKHILFYRLFAPWRYSDEICKFAHQGVKKLRDFTSLGMLLIISSRESILW